VANTYTQIHLQFVFAVQFRATLIQDEWKDELYKYMTGIVQAHKHKLIIVNGMPDHVHMLVGMRPTQSVSELLQDVKGSSSLWVNERRLTKGRFQWQQGFCAISYSKKDLPNVIEYIQNQQQHHHQKTFMEEYRNLLNEFEIEFDERYIFKEPE
jgi:putative transposase